MGFFEYCSLLIFDLDAFLQSMAENNPTEKQIDVEIQATLKRVSLWKLTEECKDYLYKLQK